MLTAIQQYLHTHFLGEVVPINKSVVPTNFKFMFDKVFGIFKYPDICQFQNFPSVRCEFSNQMFLRIDIFLRQFFFGQCQQKLSVLNVQSASRRGSACKKFAQIPLKSPIILLCSKKSLKSCLSLQIFTMSSKTSGILKCSLISHQKCFNEPALFIGNEKR